jgi:hypothetical protein
MKEVKLSLTDRACWNFDDESWCHQVTKCKLEISGALKEMKLVIEAFSEVKKGPWQN